MFSSATLALFALLPLTFASPITVQKRFTGATIRSYRTNTCLTLSGAAGDGTLLTTGDCATATKWDINPGSGSVVVSGTTFALDAGTSPSNNVPAKVWTSYPGLGQQTWYLTGDNRIAITGGTQCLDQGPAGPQTYQCTTGNTNQIWTVEGGAGPTSSAASSTVSPTMSSSSASGNGTSTSTSSTSSASASPTTGPAGPRTQIKWVTNPSNCLTLTTAPANGALLQLQGCLNATDPNVGGQQFFAFNNGPIQLAGTDFCVDAGSNPSNGGDLKLWQCYPNTPQQTWKFIPDTGVPLIQTANNQCINVDNSNFTRMQTWACSPTDPNQAFAA